MKWKPRFGLAALLILVSVIGVGFGLYGIHQRDFQAAEVRREAWLTRGFRLEVVEEEPFIGTERTIKVKGLWQQREADPEYTAELLDGLSSESSLESLVIIQRVDSETLARHLGYLPKLRYLSLANLELTPELCASIAQLSELVQLELPGCSGSFAALQQLAGCPKLELLSLKQTTLKLHEAVELNLPQLHTLDLSGCSGKTFDLSKFGLRGLPKLEKLLLAGCEIRDVELDDPPLKITALDLRKSSIQDHKNLSLALPDVTEIIIDHTDTSKITPADLARFPNLKIVYLQRSGEAYQFLSTPAWTSQPFDVRIQDRALYLKREPTGTVHKPYQSLADKRKEKLMYEKIRAIQARYPSAMPLQNAR